MSTIKILHIADVHLEAPFKYLGSKGKERRLELKETFENLLTKAEEHDVDAVFIAGDLYEFSYSTRDLGNFISKCFRLVGDTPVIIAPGNHDPYTKTSLYSLMKWPENVYIFSKNSFERVEIGDKFAVYGIANTNFLDRTNYLANLNIDESDLPCLGIMHGSYMPYSALLTDSAETCLPFTESDLRNLSLDYLALGHYHRYTEIKVDGSVIGAYPGTVEPLNFDEAGERNAIIVKIGSGGVKLEKEPTGIRSYEILEIDCSRATCLDDIISEIKRVDVSRNSIVKIVLTGEIDPSVDFRPEEIEIAANRLFYHAIVENETIPYYDLESISREQSLRGEFVRRILQKIEENPEDELVLRKALYYGLEAFNQDKREVPL